MNSSAFKCVYVCLCACAATNRTVFRPTKLRGDGHNYYYHHEIMSDFRCFFSTFYFR